MHHTMTHFRLIALTIVSLASVSSCTAATRGAVPTHAAVSTGASPLLRLGTATHTLRIEGSVSMAGGEKGMALSGLPFTATVVSTDSFRIDIFLPIGGMTAARLFATRDSFVFVNYFEQSVYQGNPNSPDLAAALPFPLTIAELSALMHGRVPGEVTRFTDSTARADGSILYRSGFTNGVEFALVDTASPILKQYQRKDERGAVLLNVTFSDVRVVNGIPIAHAVDVVVDARKQSAKFKLSSVAVNESITERLSFDAPASFARTTYR